MFMELLKIPKIKVPVYKAPHNPKRAQSKKGTLQNGHIPKRAHSKKSTFQRRHIPKTAHSKKSIFKKEHIPKRVKKHKRKYSNLVQLDFHHRNDVGCNEASDGNVWIELAVFGQKLLLVLPDSTTFDYEKSQNGKRYPFEM